ncbi:MAG: hypothetical protein J7L66_05925 [Anaerolineaceae bacterium]|nr:hypothetical protein [Anaerolineaceae bacterium]
MNKEKTKSWVKALDILIFAGFLAASLTVTVYAAESGGEGENVPQMNNGGGVERFFRGILMRTFRYQVSMTEFLGRSLEDANGSVEQAEARIDKLIEEGKDVKVLEDALSKFESLIDEAEDAYHSALSLVELHSGFNADYQVEDLADARGTITAIEPYIKTAREDIVKAIRTVYKAIQEYRLENKE